MRKSESAIVPTYSMPNAIPLFSVKQMRHQSVTSICSPRAILVLTAILMIWSTMRMRATMAMAVSVRLRWLVVRDIIGTLARGHTEDTGLKRPVSVPCYFFCVSLASMLSVAWGTARRRSLGMSLPVTRQMP